MFVILNHQFSETSQKQLSDMDLSNLATIQQPSVDCYGLMLITHKSQTDLFVKE